MNGGDVVDFHFEHLSYALCSVFYAGFFRTGFVSKDHQPWNGSCPVFRLIKILKPCWNIGFGGAEEHSTTMGGSFECNCWWHSCCRTILALERKHYQRFQHSLMLSLYKTQFAAVLLWNTKVLHSVRLVLMRFTNDNSYAPRAPHNTTTNRVTQVAQWLGLPLDITPQTAKTKAWTRTSMRSNPGRYLWFVCVKSSWKQFVVATGFHTKLCLFLNK